MTDNIDVDVDAEYSFNLEEVTNDEGTTVQITIPNLYYIKSRALLRELASFNPDLNVDRIMSLMQVMLYREEKMILY
jgi:hypothetical protein